MVGGYRSKRVEIKSVDTDLSGNGLPITAPANAVGNIFLLNNILEGFTSFTRVGLRTVPRNIRISAQIKYYTTNFPAVNLTIPNSLDRCRMIVFYDKQANNTNFSDITSLLQDNSALVGQPNVTPTTSNLSNFNLSNRGRYIILMDKYYTLTIPTPAFAPTSPQTLEVKEFIEVAKMMATQYKNVQFNGEGNPPIPPFAPGENAVNSGAFYLLFYPDQNPATTLHLYGNARYSYNENT